MTMRTGEQAAVTTDDCALLRGGQVIGADDAVIGAVGSMLMDPATASPRWVTVVIGYTGAKQTLVPLIGAYRDGQSLRVPFTAADIGAAPQVGRVDALAPGEEQALLEYYTAVRVEGID